VLKMLTSANIILSLVNKSDALIPQVVRIIDISGIWVNFRKEI
jgi:hypothetical protein